MALRFISVDEIKATVSQVMTAELNDGIDREATSARKRTTAFDPIV